MMSKRPSNAKARSREISTRKYTDINGKVPWSITDIPKKVLQLVLFKPVCRWRANAPIMVSIPVNPTKRSAKAKLITSKNVRFSFLRWIQKTNIVNMLAMRMTIVRTMRMHKNTKSVVSDITESNEWLKMNWMSDLFLYRQTERNLDCVSTSAPMALIVEK